MEPAQQLDFTQHRLEQRQNISPRQMCFDYFPLIVTHIQNIPWPREHRLLYNIAFAIDPMMEFQPQVTFQCALNYL